MASLIPIKAYRGIPGVSGSATTAYTVPTGERFIVKNIRASNNTTTSATLSVIIHTVASSPIHYFVRDIPVKANDVLLFEVNEVLEAGDKIFISQGTASALTVAVSGIEVIL